MKRLMIAVGMIVSVAVGTIAAGTIASSDPSDGQVCPHGDGWFKLDAGGGSWDPSQPDGITASIDGTQATINVADGVTLTGVCVKAGSANQGDGPEMWTDGLPLVGPGSLTVWHSSGKDISHISVMTEDSGPNPEPSPSPSPSPNPSPNPKPKPKPTNPAVPAQPVPGEPGFAG